MSQSNMSVCAGQAVARPVGDYSANLQAFQASVREFEAFVESKNLRPITPAFRALVGSLFSIIGLGLGYVVLELALRLTR